MKILTILGARPQFVKAAAVSRILAKDNKIIEKIIHTGQHFDNNMSEIFFNDMNIPKPHYNLNINGLGHGAMTGQMLEKIEEILKIEKPDWVFVYGDTNSTLAGALAAKKLKIKIAHIESGLRSFNMNMPEEINRILTDRISDILFCPTDKAVENLKVEGYENLNSRIIKNGDVMQDAAFFYAKKAVKPRISVLPSKFILATIHRQENTDNINKLKIIFDSFNEISKDVKVLIPVHPRIKDIIKNFNTENIILIEPVGYLQMIWLLKECKFVMTDSGGLQKEAFFFNKFCLTLRDQTEWIELIEKGYNRLVHINKVTILQSVRNIPNKVNFCDDLYGNGKASEKILEVIKNYN